MKSVTRRQLSLIRKVQHGTIALFLLKLEAISKHTVATYMSDCAILWTHRLKEKQWKAGQKEERDKIPDTPRSIKPNKSRRF